LNEIDDVGFYYELADKLIDEESACLIHPFPGHLNRYPFVGKYAETPLDRYILDAGELYRQFLRFMMETQWLLSALVPIRSYRDLSGLDLLVEGSERREGRENLETLAGAIWANWKRAYDASIRAKRDAAQKINPAAIRSSIATLRHLVGWRPAQTPLSRPPTQNDLIPNLHVVGYSLGGFLAQSVFFTWPFAVSSCATLCSGGALRDMALTAFAHEEEWQTVTDALRYELVSAMLHGRLKMSSDGKWVSGMNAGYFSYFDRMFYEVFVQDARSSYRERLSEYVTRLLFTVGGKDPIMPAKSVLDASPKDGGVNLVQISNLEHFVFKDLPEWRDFWLPETGRLLVSFGHHAERRLRESLQRNWWTRERTRLWDERGKVFVSPDELKEKKGQPEVPHQRPVSRDGNVELPNELFEDELDDLVEMLAKGGWLFIFRNQVPLALLGPLMLHQRGAALFYSDDRIRQYISKLQKRGKTILKNANRITIVIPRLREKWFVGDQPVSSAKSVGIGGSVPSRATLGKLWRDFYGAYQSRHALWLFDPERTKRPLSESCRVLEEMVRTRLGISSEECPVTNQLPNAWICFSGSALQGLELDRQSREKMEEGLVKLAISLETVDQRPAMKGSSVPGDDHTRKSDRFNRLLAREQIRFVQVSVGESNPGYRGRRIGNQKGARLVLTHGALAYAHSYPAPDKTGGRMSGK